MKIISVVGARPNFMKIAPIIKELSKFPNIEHILVHTGQHYDYAMSGSFFKELGIPKPDVNLEIGPASHAEQVGLIMIKLEKVLKREKPDVVLVVGDVNSTMATSLVAAKLLIPIAHIEAGLRSFDRAMPEEINRVVTDSVSDSFFTTCKDANRNLQKEGVPRSRIYLVGNVMIDTLLQHVKKARESNVMRRLGLHEKPYALVTLHRPSNVDDKTVLVRIISALTKIQKRVTVVFPIHPRTKKRLKHIMTSDKWAEAKNIILTEPLPYYDFLNLMSNSKFVITDSGGIQEETTALKIPCLTIRQNTERPITVAEGTNILVGTDEKRIVCASFKILEGNGKNGRCPKLWDGKAARRIAEVLVKKYDHD